MTERSLSRRHWLQSTAAGLAAISLPRQSACALAPEASGCTLSIGTYSMPGWSLEKSIDAIAAIGYDGLEIAAQPGFDGEPERMSAERRQQVRKLLADRGLKLTALMEHLGPAAEDSRHKADTDRLRRVFELSRDLSPNQPPLVQTVLGGGVWEEKRNLFRDRLTDWQAAAQQAQVVLAIKPHRGGALSRPAEAVWLIEQLGNSPHLRMVYDYSHYAFRDLPLEETVRTALPVTGHLAVKDAVQQNGKVAFLLPGESGEFDYARLLRLFYDGGYRADVCCEVSSMVSGKPGYDPLSAAKSCYASLARAFEQAKVPRS